MEYVAIMHIRGIKNPIMKMIAEREYWRIYDIYNVRCGAIVDRLNAEWDAKHGTGPLEGKARFEYDEFLYKHFKKIADDINRNRVSKLLDIFVNRENFYVHGILRRNKKSNIWFTLKAED